MRHTDQRMIRFYPSITLMAHILRKQSIHTHSLHFGAKISILFHNLKLSVKSISWLITKVFKLNHCLPSWGCHTLSEEQKYLCKLNFLIQGVNKNTFKAIFLPHTHSDKLCFAFSGINKQAYSSINSGTAMLRETGERKRREEGRALAYQQNLDKLATSLLKAKTSAAQIGAQL